uniref:LacI family DNA-binding transcriptional regulator n=1 Tax=Rhizobium giardinii TaxID=56731 RepID=UPI000368513F
MDSTVRLSDVAKRAEVGVGTVSRVLNGSINVSAATRQKVLAAIAELGYVPNLVARSLAANRTGLIAAIIPVIGYTQHSEVIQGMTDVLHAHGMNLMIGASGYSDEVELQVIEAFLARRPDAIYVTGVRHTEAVRSTLQRSGIPVIEGSNLTDRPIDTVVGYSNFNASVDLTRLLIDCGYRRIWHVTVTKDFNDRIDDRLAGFRWLTSTETELEADVIRCENSFDGGAEAVRLALASNVKVEALTFATDVMAVGGLLECQRQGINVPAQLAIAGFDDLTIAASINPSLTTVKVDRVDLGRKAAEIIVTRLQGNNHFSPIVDVGFQIVERDSTQRRSSVAAKPE